VTLQPERTDLAWRRTGLSTLGLSLVGVKLGFDATGPHVLAGAVAAVAAACFAGLARHRSGQLRASDDPPAMRPRSLLVLTGTLVVFDLAGLALVLAPT
jgi:hypothetical protein